MAKRRRSPTSYLRADADFHSLSIRDLLEARDAYHVHLTHMDNVIATAIGRYRIRRGDPDVSDPARFDPARTRRRGPSRARSCARGPGRASCSRSSASRAPRRCTTSAFRES